MSGEYEQIPESFIKELEAKRKRLVEAQEENGVNLDALVDFLYPDTAHLIFELLQNAEDAGAVCARFELGETKLSFVHDGRPFSEQDLDDITNYFKSAKYEKENKIGRFGIGFKSVFTCTDTPRIYSDTVAFEIENRVVPRAIPRPASAMRLSNRETVIELPFNGTMRTADEVGRVIRLGLEGMPTTSVLHLHHIESIEWLTDRGDQGSITRVELEGGVVRVDVKKPTGPKSHFFLRFREPYAEGSSMHLDVVFELEEQEQRSLDEPVAPADRFRIVAAKTGQVAVFFPAAKETSKLRFHLHAPFIPDLSRASIKEHADNAALIGRLAALAAKSLETIRELGFLDREFLGVLPNSRDHLSEAYKPFHEAIVRAMHEEPLVPTYGGGHERAARLLQGPADLKAFLGVDDIRFLMSGWDYDTRYRYPGRPRTDRSTVPSSTYRGWAVSATQRHSAVDRLLSDLAIREFKTGHLAPPDSTKAGEIKEWLGTRDATWHRSYYASLHKYWEEKGRGGSPSDSRGGFDRLRKLAIVRTRSAEYRRAAECRFANDRDSAPEGVRIVDPDTYSNGTGAKRARDGLIRLGVQEIDDEGRAIGILDKYYGHSGLRPTWNVHKNHVKWFIELVKSGEVSERTFGHRRLLLTSTNGWEQPNHLYAGDDYACSSAAPYYRFVAGLSEWQGRSAVRCELHGRYRDIPGFDGFAERVGVAYKNMVIERAECWNNPRYGHLKSGGGTRWTDNGTDRDWHVPHLGEVLQRFERTQQAQAERRDLARAIQATLKETIDDTWPPPDDPRLRDSWSYEPIDTGRLVAIYRRNTNAGFRTAPSQLVATLRSHAWIPQELDGDELVFVKPGKARRDALPDGFTVDSGWAWIKAVGFGEARRERQRRIAQGKLDQEAEASEQTALAKDLGFASSEEAQFFGGLPQEVKREFKEKFESRNRPPPDFERHPNPKRRRERAVAKARDARDRETEHRQRSALVGGDKLKEEAREMLRARYEQRAHSSLCQVVGCADRSFMLNGAWYFEAVRFLGLDRMVSDDYVALCPRHAAMYLNANEPDGLKRRFAQACAEGVSRRGDHITVPVVLAGEPVAIILAPKHAIDLAAALEVDGEKRGG